MDIAQLRWDTLIRDSGTAFQGLYPLIRRGSINTQVGNRIARQVPQFGRVQIHYLVFK